MRLLCALLVLSLAPPATAAGRSLEAGAPAAANQRYNIGIRLYRAGNYAEAAREFRVAQSLYPASNKLAFNLGRALERSGDLSGAIEQYEAYLARASEAKERDEVIAIIAALKAELADRAGTLRISSDPAGASIYLDDDLETPRGRTPLSLHLRPGHHSVRLWAEGFVAADREVELGMKETRSLVLTLVPLSAEPPPVAETDWRPIVGWASLGLGVASVALGTISHVQASTTFDDAEGLGVGRQSEADALEGDFEGQQTLMYVGYGAGAALIGGGAALLLF